MQSTRDNKQNVNRSYGCWEIPFFP